MELEKLTLLSRTGRYCIPDSSHRVSAIDREGGKKWGTMEKRTDQ